MKRWEVINSLIQKHDYLRYLEIGVDNPNNCFNKIIAPHKYGVDPKGGGTHRMTSDRFFAENRFFYDIIFIDGLHIAEQVIRDVENSLCCLAQGGVILVHDLNPQTEEEQNENRTTQRWYGSTWRAWAYFRATRPDLHMQTIDTDCGIGIIHRGGQEIYKGPCASWQDFVNNRQEILNLVPVEEFQKCLSM
jgi:hypothetical protein